jgi:predicted dehydrogenase
MNGLLRIEKFINQKNIMSKVSVLIIGAGNISLQHLNSLITLKDIKLYGILSRTKIKSVKISKQFKIPHVLNSYEEIDYHITNIDLMMICVDSDQTIKVFNKIKKYKKFIFFEKPIGINLKESKIIFKEVQKYNLKTFVGFNRRYYSIKKKPKTFQKYSVLAIY